MAGKNIEEQDILALLEKIDRNDITQGELHQIDLWYDSFNQAKLYTDGMSSAEEEQAMFMLLEKIHNKVDDSKLIELAPSKKLKKMWNSYRWKIIAAASIVFILGTVSILRQRESINNNPKITTETFTDSNIATLTLADGKRIELTTDEYGEIANESGVRISKTKDGQLVYEIQNSSSAIEGFNTICTSVGKTFQIRLSDGTSVWLNAATKLKFPSRFQEQKTRSVELEGEAFFEVAKSETQQFIVKSRDQDVRVLGTQFNVKSYTNESKTETTLMEGSVKVTRTEGRSILGKGQVLLKPGQQSTLNRSGFSVNKVDTKSVLAWRNGYLLFENETMENVMRQLSRWYGIEVSFEDNAARKVLFYGTIERYKNFSDVLDILRLTGEVELKTQGKKVLVSKKQ